WLEWRRPPGQVVRERTLAIVGAAQAELAHKGQSVVVGRFLLDAAGCVEREVRHDPELEFASGRLEAAIHTVVCAGQGELDGAAVFAECPAIDPADEAGKAVP